MPEKRRRHWIKKNALCAGGLAVIACFQAGALEDPMRPYEYKEAEALPGSEQTRPHWRLAYTLIAGERRQALINGRWVTRGDRVDGARVMQIDPGSVRLKYDSKGIFLTLLPEEIKKTSPTPR